MTSDESHIDYPGAGEGQGRLQREIGLWGLETFPASSLASIYAHLTHEVRELGLEIAGASEVRGSLHECLDARRAAEEEIADCAILLHQLAFRLGFDLEAAVRKKFAVNRKRTWGKPDPVTGVVHHMESDGAE